MSAASLWLISSGLDGEFGGVGQAGELGVELVGGGRHFVAVLGFGVLKRLGGGDDILVCHGSPNVSIGG